KLALVKFHFAGHFKKSNLKRA
ncbi:unnamed protein product, partial [Oikopleura dioica]